MNYLKYEKNYQKKYQGLPDLKKTRSTIKKGTKKKKCRERLTQIDSFMKKVLGDTEIRESFHNVVTVPIKKTMELRNIGESERTLKDWWGEPATVVGLKVEELDPGTFGMGSIYRLKSNSHDRTAKSGKQVGNKEGIKPFVSERTYSDFKTLLKTLEASHKLDAFPGRTVKDKAEPLEHWLDSLITSLHSMHKKKEGRVDDSVGTATDADMEKLREFLYGDFGKSVDIAG